MDCVARKYTAYIGKTKSHHCQATPLKPDVSKNVRNALAINTFTNPATNQTASILDAIRNRVPTSELLAVVQTFTDRRNIFNGLSKARKEIEPTGFDAIRNVKSCIDSFIIFRID